MEDLELEKDKEKKLRSVVIPNESWKWEFLELD